jgi:hypothetical protein
MQRGLAACAVMMLVLAQLGSLLHHATVRHVRCEHGELVEAPALAKHAAGDSQLVGVEAGDASGADEHCAIANGQRADARPAIACIEHVLAPTGATPVVAAVTFHASVPIFRTAPKTSPPA